jgi:hypothetical protein
VVTGNYDGGSPSVGTVSVTYQTYQECHIISNKTDGILLYFGKVERNM